MSETVRTLWVLRHAKAQQEGATDHARALSERGHRDAQALGHWLAGRPPRPSLALVSSATRTRQTWVDLAAAAGLPAVGVTFDDRLYLADPGQLLAVLAEVEEAARTVLLVGHNPGIADLVNLLIARDVSAPSAVAQFDQGVPTGCAMVLEVGGGTGWSSLAAASARLVDMAVPRG